MNNSRLLLILRGIRFLMEQVTFSPPVPSEIKALYDEIDAEIEQAENEQAAMAAALRSARASEATPVHSVQNGKFEKEKGDGGEGSEEG